MELLSQLSWVRPGDHRGAGRRRLCRLHAGHDPLRPERHRRDRRVHPRLAAHGAARRPAQLLGRLHPRGPRAAGLLAALLRLRDRRLFRDPRRSTTAPACRSCKQLDELGGAIFGLIFVGLVICLQIVVLDSFFLTGGETGGWVAAYYEALNDSLIVTFLRESVIPTVGVIMAAHSCRKRSPASSP